MIPEPMAGLHQLPTETLRRELRRRLSGSRFTDSDLRVGAISPLSIEKVRALLPAQPTRAAVLIPLVDRGDELTVAQAEKAVARRRGGRGGHGRR